MLHVPDPGGGGCTLLDPHTLPGWAVDHDKPQTVWCSCLSDFAISNVGLVKIDVEGNELGVWEGMVDFLRRNEWPPVIFEAWGQEWFAERKAKLLEYVAKLGYVRNPDWKHPDMPLVVHS